MSKKRDEGWKDATKKKPKKPRKPPVEELSDLEREERADEALEKARIHLAEAVALAPWGEAPNACVHSSYYAMYFTAVAALFRSGGVGKRKSVPESHEHVLQHFISLCERQASPLNASGKSLNRARDLRVECDYYRDSSGQMNSGVHGESKAEAAELAVEAETFMKDWEGWYPS